MSQLIEIINHNDNFTLDLRYFSKNNVCSKQLYKNNKCFLHKEAAEKFYKAVQIAKLDNLKLKIFDCYRPLNVQRYMFEKFLPNKDLAGFVSDPVSGAIPHCRAIAIDLTLTNIDNEPLAMGSDFDEFSKLAYHNNTDIDIKEQENRKKLLKIMTKVGFDFYEKEWWHYQLHNPRNFPIIDNYDDLSNI